MSQCFTLRHTGLLDGIATVATHLLDHPLGVDLGTEYKYDETAEKPRIRKRWIKVLLDSFRPPVVDVNGLVMNASITQGGGNYYLKKGPATERGILVLIDTSHTEPCETGGFWVPLNGSPRTIAQGHKGKTTYHLRHRSMPNGETERRASYTRSLVLMLPGDSLGITFHAPGSVVGILRYSPTARGLQFKLTQNEVGQTTHADNRLTETGTTRTKP